MVRFLFCILFVLPLLPSEAIYAGETCRVIVKVKGTTIQHEETILEGKSFSSRFNISHDAGLEKTAEVYIAYRIHYLSNGKELTEDCTVRVLTKGEGKQVKVRWPICPDFVPEKILFVDIVEALCHR